MCVPLLNAIRVPRIGAGRPRTTPEAVLGDKAYSSRAIRTELRRRGIVSVIPEPRDQQAHRKRRGPKGGRPVSYDVEVYKGRNVVDGSSTTASSGAAWRPGTTSTPTSTGAGHARRNPVLAELSTLNRGRTSPQGPRMDVVRARQR
jgi:hypothetical protein